MTIAGISLNSSDSQISDAVIKNMPNGLYSSVRTSKDSHYFGGAGKLTCRKIVLQRTTVSSFFESIKAFFLTLFNKNDPDKRYGATLNENKILDFIVTGEGTKEELEKAYISCKTVIIYVAPDPDNKDNIYSDVELLDSKLICNARIVAKLIRFNK